MISLIVPTYNERQNVAALVERAAKALTLTDQPFELIIVDDRSPDGTAEEVRRLSAERAWLRLIVREGERDLSTAVVAGWREAHGDILGCMDGDLQQPPEVLTRLFERLESTGADIVVASRNVRGGGVSDWSLYRRFISWTATLMATFILPGTLGEVRDPMSGYFLLRASVIRGAALNSVGYKILLEVLARGNYRRVEEVPFIFEERALGESKLGGGVVLKYLAHLVRISVETREAVRIVKYAAVGLTGAAVNFVALRWLIELRHRRLSEAALAGVALAILNNFVWNEVVTFPEARALDPSALALFRRFLAFLGFSAAGAVLNLALIAVLIGGLNWPLEPGVLAGILAAGLWNFTTNSNLTWRAWWNRKTLARAARADVAAPASLRLSSRFDSRSASLRDSKGGGVSNVEASRRSAGAALPAPPGMQLVPCALCGSTPSEVLYRGRTSRPPSFDPKSVCCTSLGHGEFSNIVQCSACGLIYQNPRDDDETLQKLYAGVDDPVYERESEGRVRTFARLVERLERYAAAPHGGMPSALPAKAGAGGADGESNPAESPKRRTLFEIGCYTGIFLEQARRSGWDAMGVEPSAWAAALARKKGFNVAQGRFRDAHDLPAPFDAVAIWDVIEHVPDPLGDLRHAYAILKPGGVLGLSTMDTASLFARLAGRHWPWYMRMHLTYFTRDSIRRMLEAAGFEAITIERHQRIVSLRYFLEKASSLLPAPLSEIGHKFAAPFGNVYSVFQLGDIMNVFARRPL